MSYPWITGEEDIELLEFEGVNCQHNISRRAAGTTAIEGVRVERHWNAATVQNAAAAAHAAGGGMVWFDGDGLIVMASD